jgi:hypothetical protein
MPGKRQHYVPRFLLRRFAVAPEDKRSLIWKLEKASGRPLRVNPANEAVVGHYYRMVLEDGEVVDEADTVLDRVEDMAVNVIRRLAEASYTVSGDDVQVLMLFIATLKARTPQTRETLREMDERAAELTLEMQFSDRDHYHKTVRARQPERSEEDIEAERVQSLEDLRAGRIGIASTPEREVALMFAGLEETTKTLFEQLAIRRVSVPEGAGVVFVLSDHPVAHYDPEPKTPEAGAGFISSPGSQTWVALDPSFGLLLSAESPGTWEDVTAGRDEVDELNLLTYAWAREAIYGPTQQAVTRVRQVAKQKPRLLGEFRYRPGRVWIARGDGSAGPHEFRSRFRGETVTRELHVAEDARGEGPPPAARR